MKDSTQIDQIIKKTLHPDVEVNYTGESCAAVYFTQMPIKFIIKDNLLQILLFIWKECLKQRMAQSSIIIFDECKEIVYNGLFSFKPFSNDDGNYKSADYNFHLIISDAKNPNIEFNIEINNSKYTGNFNARVDGNRPIYDWYEYFCKASTELLKMTCVGVLFMMHKIPLTLLEGHSLNITIHHVNLESYKWQYFHRNITY